MFLRNLGLGATLALAANAFLLPPNVDKSINTDPRLERLGVDTRRQMFKVPCVGCPYAIGTGEAIVWTDGVKNDLIYNFHISKDGQALFLNDAQIYPPPTFQALMTHPIYIQQSPSVKDGEFTTLEMPTVSLHLSDFVVSHNAAETISEEGNELIPMNMVVKKIADLPIQAQAIRIFLIKDVTGQLSIANIESVDSPDRLLIGAGMIDCETWPMLCRFRQALEQKLDALRSHRGGKRPCGRPGRLQGDRPNPPHHPHHDRPHKEHGHRPHHHHPHSMKHRIMKGLVRLTKYVLVPLFVGVLCGALAYFVGWLFGMTAACLYMFIQHRRRGGYGRVALDEETEPLNDDDETVAGDDEETPYGKEEKEVFVAEVEGEAPPVYVEVPADEPETK